MPINFVPLYTITPKIMDSLLRIEAVKEKVVYFPLTVSALKSLRETTRLFTTHYSTMIEGNRLIPDQIRVILTKEEHFAGREREEHEVKGYYAALTQVEQWVNAGYSVNEKMIQTLHALVMSNSKSKIKPSLYRDGQNAIKDSKTKTIIYLPPEAHDGAKYDEKHDKLDQ